MVFLNTRGGTESDCGFGGVSVTQKPVYRLNEKRWQSRGLAGSADGLNASGPDQRHVLREMFASSIAPAKNMCDTVCTLASY